MPQRVDAGPSFSRELAVASFDSAWARITRSYYDTTFHGLDWSALREEARRKTERSASAAEAREVLESLFLALGESHFALVPSEVADQWRATDEEEEPGDGETGLEFRFLAGEVVVSHVRRDSPADRSGVRAGWVVERIGHVGVAKLIAGVTHTSPGGAERLAALRIPLVVRHRTTGAVGTPVTIAFRDGVGDTVVRTVVREEPGGEVVRFGHLPPQHVRVDAYTVNVAGGCVGVLRFNTWMTALMPAFDSAMVASRECRGVVIDLRGNTGGIAAMVIGVGAYLTDSSVTLGAMMTRGTTLRYIATPRGVDRRGEELPPFAGDVAIVVDGVSASTSEIFAAGMQAIGRARIFGERTAGQALPSVVSRLPNGDLLQHVVADFRDAAGRRVEGVGVVPDELALLTRDALLDGRDAPLEAALRWMSRPRGAPVSAARP